MVSSITYLLGLIVGSFVIYFLPAFGITLLVYSQSRFRRILGVILSWACGAFILLGSMGILMIVSKEGGAVVSIFIGQVFLLYLPVGLGVLAGRFLHRRRMGVGNRGASLPPPFIGPVAVGRVGSATGSRSGALTAQIDVSQGATRRGLSGGSAQTGSKGDSVSSRSGSGRTRGKNKSSGVNSVLESRVIELHIAGKSAHQISEQLSISDKSVQDILVKIHG